MDKQLERSLSIVVGGYIFSLGFYIIWCFYFYYNRLNSGDNLLVIAAVVFAITAIYFFPFSLIWYIKSLQRVWASFCLISIITLSIFFLIPHTNYGIYYKFHNYKSNLEQGNTIKTTDKIEPERQILASKKTESRKQGENAKEKALTEQKRMKIVEFKLYKSHDISHAANTSITELQAELEFERKENDRLRKELNETISNLRIKDETILALKSKLKEEHKAEEKIVEIEKANRDSSEIKINSKVDDTDLDSLGQEIIFKVQIITSGALLSKNSPKLMDLKNVWVYEDAGLYKYTVGKKKDLKSASVLQSELRRKGFVGAFVVAFKNGKRIPVREAQKLLK